MIGFDANAEAPITDFTFMLRCHGDSKEPYLLVSWIYYLAALGNQLSNNNVLTSSIEPTMGQYYICSGLLERNNVSLLILLMAK